MTRKTGNKWSTSACPRCGCKHENYSGKLDRDNKEYVVCGVTNKRLSVRLLSGIQNPCWDLVRTVPVISKVEQPKLKCKDINDVLFLQVISRINNAQWGGNATWFDISAMNSITYAFKLLGKPYPAKLILAKCRMLHRRGLIRGCICSCRGDFKLTDKGEEFLYCKQHGTETPISDK